MRPKCYAVQCIVNGEDCQTVCLCQKPKQSTESWNFIPVTCVKCRLLEFGVKLAQKSGELYTYVKLRENFIRIQYTGRDE